MNLPSFRSRQSCIAIEINPIDTTGAPTKKTGIVIRSVSELNQFNNILAEERYSY